LKKRKKKKPGRETTNRKPNNADLTLPGGEAKKSTPAPCDKRGKKKELHAPGLRGHGQERGAGGPLRVEKKRRDQSKKPPCPRRKKRNGSYALMDRENKKRLAGEKR